MGAPKQKWTSEEEAALKAGVAKHGVGKWRTIIKDPEFNRVLFIRSNVDLKDKWRNLSVMGNGSSSREKSKGAIKRLNHPVPKQDDNSMAITAVTGPSDDDEIVDAQPLQVSRDMPHIPGPKRLDNLILEAISSLNELGGSNTTTIASFIEDQYRPPADFKKLLSAKLKYLTSSGKLIKVKRRYRIAPTPSYSNRERQPPMLLLEGRQKTSMKLDRVERKYPTKSEIDLEIEKVRSMSAQEAAAYAARAVADAEAAIAEAEEAAKEAEAAEADAAAAEAFAEAALKTLKGRNTSETVSLGFSFFVIL
ncbi:myb transcription factor [Medicago truncatula]|uniref:MYB transcription factor n=1 Tax=Medicago truncatula TaxID=3880 RepID=A0A072TVN7_MEDTR|nr:myb transcription factor [Medicago truncatula]